MTRSLNHIFAILILIALTSPAVSEGQASHYLTLQVDSAPAEVQDAYLQLDEQTWAPLRRVSEHQWRGEFLLLPELYNAISKPEIRFLGRHGEEFQASEKARVKMASSSHSPSQLSTLLDEETLVVVSDHVVKETLVFQGSEGTVHHPRFQGSAFVLPAVQRNELVAIQALTREGSEVSFNLGLDVDLAELEESP